MKLILFELKKIWRQKKLLWLILFVTLTASFVFIQNYTEHKKTKERQLQKLELYTHEGNQISTDYREKLREVGLTESEEIQFGYLQKMNVSLFNWNSAIYNENWYEIPLVKKEFFKNLIEYEASGGAFSLTGNEQEIEIAKTNWLVVNDLPYVEEEFSVSPILNLKESSKLLFGLPALFLLLLLFGNAMATEKEERTWFTLKTQPISKMKIILSKYISILIFISIYVITVCFIGLLIPFFFGEPHVLFQYPHLITTTETFTIISTFEYIARNLILFFSICLILFSLVFLCSNWIQSSFGTFISVGLLLSFGYYITTANEWLQSPYNLFSHLQITEIATSLSESVWIYLLFGCIWSYCFIFAALFLPHKEIDLFEKASRKKAFQKGRTKKYIPLLNVTIFEWRKLLRKGLFKQLSLLLVVLLMFGYYSITKEGKEKEDLYLQYIYSHTLYEPVLTNDTIETYKKLKKEAEDLEEMVSAAFYQDQIELWKTHITYMQSRAEKAKEALEAFHQGNWKTFYEYQLLLNREVNGEIEENSIHYDKLLSQLNRFTVAASIAEKNWLMQHNITPIISGDFIPTIYVDFGIKNKEMESEWLKDNTKVDNSSLYSIYHSITSYWYVVLLALLLFLIGGGITTERGKKSTLNLLKTQPLSFKALLFGKISSGFFITIVFFVSSILFLFTAGAIFNRLGDWNYPILHYDSKSIYEAADYRGIKTFQGGFHFIPLGEFILESLLLIILVALFSIILSIFLSVFIKNQFTLFGTFITITVLGYMFSIQEALSEWSHLLPFTYFNVPKIVNGELAAIANNPSLNTLIGSIVLVTFILVLLSASYFSTKNSVSKKIEGKETLDF